MNGSNCAQSQVKGRQMHEWGKERSEGRKVEEGEGRKECERRKEGKTREGMVKGRRCGYGMS